MADSVEHAVASGLPSGDKVLVACSGGADSSALAKGAIDKVAMTNDAKIIVERSFMFKTNRF